MVYKSKNGTIVNALCTPILGESRSHREMKIEGNKATILFHGRNNHGLPINLQCTGVNSPVRFRGINLDDKGNYQMQFEMIRPNQQPFTHQKPEEPHEYTLQFATSTPLQETVHQISKAILREQKEPEEKRHLQQLPDSFETFLRYQTQTGEWNSLPQELLPYTTKFEFKVRNMGIQYEKFREGIIKLTPAFQQFGNSELYDELVKKLQTAKLIERVRTETGNQTYDTITLTNPKPREVMRPLEDVLRDFDNMPLEQQWEEYGGKVEIEIHGRIPLTTLARIPKNLPMQAGIFKSELLTIDTYQERGFNSPKTTTISLNGTLETAARIENLLPYLKDLKIQAYDPKDSTQRPIPLFSISNLVKR